MIAYSTELKAAIHAASLASELILKAYEIREADPKAQANITTQTDLMSQEVILGYLMREFPEDAFAAEEDTQAIHEAKRQADRLWVVDPIDGTRGFVRKNGEFSVMIGLRYLNSLAYSTSTLIRARSSIKYSPTNPACHDVPQATIKILSALINFSILSSIPAI